MTGEAEPYDEYECGHWYARALASYSYLQAYGGMRYDAVGKTLYLSSKTPRSSPCSCAPPPATAR